MDPSVVQRMRGRRARAHASQENLVKDSSSDISPRESTSTAPADRRRQRRAHHSPNTQQYDNQAFADDERPLPPPIEHDDGDDEIEEENIQNAERLVSHVAKQHRRAVNEVQQQNKKSKKKLTTTADDVDQDQENIHDQIREQQEIASKRLGDAPEDEETDRVSTLEPTSSIRRPTTDRSVESILERAKKSRLGKSIDDDQQATMGSSRRFGTSSELRLQQMVRRYDKHIDASGITSPTGGDRSTRFDYEAQDEQIRKEISAKREERTNRWKQAIKKSDDVPLPSEQDDFFLKIWPDEKTEPKPQPTTTTTDATTEPRTTDEAVVPVEEPVAALAEKMPLLHEFGEAQPIQYQRAERELDDDDERDVENEKLKYVIGEQINLQQKLGEGIVEPRSLEDEGIFVGRKPIVPTNVINRAEKRILQECQDEKKPMNRWFGPDGAITSLPDPTKFVPTRPLIDDLYDPALSREFHKAYVADPKDALSNDVIGADRYRLDIDLGTIAFLHHHQMNVEHVLAMKLKQMYEHYTVRTQQRIVHQLSEKIKALKTAENNCRALYEQNRYSESALPDEIQNRLINYQKELRQTRNQRCNEMRLDRQLLERLLSTWKRIKDIRKINGYTSTPARLIIKQISAKKTKQYEQMQQQIEEEIEDEIAEADEEYQRQKAAYADIVKKRKLQAIRQKEARKRVDKKRDAVGAGDAEYDQADIAILNEDEIPLPEKPEARKPDEIRTKILMNYQNAVKPPDEPEILLELVYSEQISTDAECNAREQARRHALQTSGNIFARILINGKLMTTTRPAPLNNDFEGSFGQIYPCYVVRTPETIQIQIFESTRIFPKLIAEVYLPIPEPTITSENYKLQSYEFSSNLQEKYDRNRTTAVGAGVLLPIELDELERFYLTIEGFLNAGVAWGVQDGEVLVPSDYATSKACQKRLLDGQSQALYINDMKHLAEWVKQSNIDPCDPENAFLINLVKNYAGSSEGNYALNALQHFRLWIDENDETEHERKQAELDNSLRFKLLQARKENIPYFKDYKRVPAYDYLVRKEHGIFKSYMARQKETADGDDLDQQYPEKRLTRIDTVRKQGERQLRKMREQVLARFALTSGRKAYHQMVIEESIPNIQALSGFLSKLYIEPARPLYPAAHRPEQKKVAVSNLAITANRDVFILVNIIGAIDLPVRQAALETEKSKGIGRDKAEERISLIRPYVEIQFQKNTYRTSTVDGPNPSWNEELRIPFRPPDNDFDASSLQRCRDILYINIFDQLDVDLPTADRERGRVIRKRIERNWLGSVKIPFSNVYVNGRLEGSYRINVPNPLLGYARERLVQTRADSANKEPTASVLRMFVTMEPVLSPPETIQQSFDSTESPQLLNNARDWAETLHTRFPNRDFKVTVADINGRAVFIPRFLRPLPLPPLTTSATTTDSVDPTSQCQRLARFVSLIPFLSDTITFPGICDIWETSDQFLRTMAGDDEEHAVLLNNYFRQLNKKSWIAMGLSIYSGPCCFVLTKEDGEYYPTCWSVADGHDAKTKDTWNPIRSIYLLANEENVWANIQQQDLPSRMSFDVNNAKHWKPFLDPSKTGTNPPWTSVQPSDLHYEVTQMEDVRSLERHINDILRNKFMEWRGSYVTSWHWSCQKILQDITKQKEPALAMGRMPNALELESALADIQRTHEITGFPLQMPYSNVQTIIDTVYSTKIFEHSTNDIEFALAVHVYPYPNNILAVWIYVAHLTKRKLA